MRKQDRENLIRLSDTTLDLEERLHNMQMTKADAMEIFNDAEVQAEWLEMCRGRILLTALPDLLERLKSDAISGKESTRVASQKLFLQVINALKVEDHKHIHLNNYSDDRLQSEIDQAMRNIKELSATSFPSKGSRIDAEFEEMDG